MILLTLYWSFFQIGLFSIGGGYAALPLIQNQVVDLHGWLTMTEFADVVTLSQMTPGPIAINAASFIGIRRAGIPGAIIATLGCITPSIVISLLLAYVYYRYRGLATFQGIMKGLRPAVVSLITSAGISLVLLAFWKGEAVTADLTKIDWLSVGIFTLALFILRKWKVSQIAIMVGAGILGLCIYPFLS
ncbi:MAG: chromate transporter [Herbinix sp.]|jgi:chromate transporter|nr:chromate transporter [Herbinix sp.]